MAGLIGAFKRDPRLTLALIIHTLGRNFRLKLFEFGFRSKVWCSTICSIRKNGYAVIPGYLKPEEVSFLQAVCDKSAEEIDGLRGDAYFIAEAPGSLRLRHMENRHPEMDYFRRHIKIAALSICLHGRLHWPSVQYSATYDGRDNPDFVPGRADKPFGGACHVDQWHHQLKAVFLLDDVYLENGPLMVYPGTWRPQWDGFDVYRLKKWNKTHNSQPPTALSHLRDDNFPPEFREKLERTTAVPITGKAGDLILFDTRTLHFAKKIETGRRRLLWFYF